jgi:hypothetical protein
MSARIEAATAFVQLWQFLVETIGAAAALADRALQAARRQYVMASTGATQ